MSEEKYQSEVTEYLHLADRLKKIREASETLSEEEDYMLDRMDILWDRVPIDYRYLLEDKLETP